MNKSAATTLSVYYRLPAAYAFPATLVSRYSSKPQDKRHIPVGNGQGGPTSRRSPRANSSSWAGSRFSACACDLCE